MLDRDEKDNLPKMQIGFIDSICLPLYKVYERTMDNNVEKKIKTLWCIIRPYPTRFLGPAPFTNPACRIESSGKSCRIS